MTTEVNSIKEVWDAILAALLTDDSVTPSLHGFLELIEPAGVIAGTLYLNVPNDFYAQYRSSSDCVCRS